jgi:hypothetical protein
MKKYKTLATITLVLILTAAALMAVMPSANSAVVERDTYIHVMVAPNPIGVNQQLLVTLQIDKTDPSALGLVGGDHFRGLTLTITRPDGTTEVKGPYETYAMSGYFLSYVPTQVGEYTFQASWPGQWSNTTGFFGAENYFRPATSTITRLTVQEEPITDYPDNIQSQSEPWQRPIYSENKGWFNGADNWLMQAYDYNSRSFCISTAFSPYTSAPNSAHILWKKPIYFGGIAGGKFGDKNYYGGLSYEQFYLPFVLEGRIYYVEHGPSTGTSYGTRVLNLYTGEEIMFLDGIAIEFIQVLDIENPNEHGTIAHLWDTMGPSSNHTAVLYDAFTGRELSTIINIPWGGYGSFSGSETIMGDNGEVLSYRFSGGRLTMWNSTRAISAQYPWIGDPPEGGGIYSLPVGGLVDGSLGIQYNVSAPAMGFGTGISVIGEGYILVQGRDDSGYPQVITDMAFDQETGQHLWTKTRTDIYSSFFRRPVVISNGVYVMHDEEKLEQHGYSIQTGDKLWTTIPNKSGWGIFTYQMHIAYDKLYTTGYEGDIRAFDIEDGSLVWEYFMGNAGFETVYNSWPTYNGFTIADGKIFVGADEHSTDSVLWRGGKLWAVDTETGEEVWKISGMFRNPVVADGILTALNSYDGQVYTFGKGPSKTTVTAPQNAVEVGESFTIVGTVTDQTPSSKDTPAISDEDMTAWMEHLHMQKAIPADAKGVDVSLDALDPNGNFIHIGETTSDMSGCFGYTWTPEVPGTYQLIATFAGSESYGSSYATTYLSSVAAPEPTPPPEATPAPLTDTYVLGMGAAAIVAIIVIGLLIVLMLRKR